ncbi:MAG TPA: PHB depolymerase family esterase [Actinopolymorphaceae bacterium]|jgi:polyhydroxybutyrate depolymerase
MAPVPQPHRRVDVTVDGVARWYLIAEPPAGAHSVRRPVVIDLHGHAEGAIRHATSTRFGELGIRDGFVTVTPQGSGMVARWHMGAGSPDVRFLFDLIDAVADRHDVDPERIYVTGMSNGGVIAATLAASRPARIAAIGPVAGIWNAPIASTARAVPAVIVHGTEDRIVGYEGGIDSAQARMDTPPIEDTVAAYALHNGCLLPPTVEKVAPDVERWSYRRPPPAAGGAVDFIRVIGGGHTWPGATPVNPERWGTTSSFDATAAIWRFFDSEGRR